MSSQSTTNTQSEGAEYSASEWNSRAEFDAWLHQSELNDTANEDYVEYLHQNGLDFSDATSVEGPVGDPYEAVAYCGNYTIGAINLVWFYATMNAAGISDEQIMVFLSLAAGLNLVVADSASIPEPASTAANASQTTNQAVNTELKDGATDGNEELKDDDEDK